MGRDPVRERRRALAVAQVGLLSPDETLTEDVPETPSALDTALAYGHTETLVGGLVDYARVNLAAGAEERDPLFSPTAFFAEHQDEFKALAPFVEAGSFDGIQNEAGFRAKAEVIRDELESRKTIQNSSVLGHVAGFGVAAVADLGAIVPALTPAKTIVGRSLKTAGAFAGVTAAQEAALMGLQETREPAEAVTATLTAALLGSAVGPLAYALQTRAKVREIQEVIDPRNAIPMRDLVPGEPSAKAAGAAAAPGEDVEFVRGPIGKTIDTVASRLGPFGKTPTVVAAGATLNSARKALNDLVDLGLTTKTSLDGEAIATTAEDLLILHEQRAAVFSSEFDKLHRRANIAAGGSDAAFNLRRSVGQTGVGFGDFSRAVMRRVLRPNDPLPSVPFSKEIDEAAQLWRRYYEDYYNEGVRHGMFPADKRIEDYVPQMWNRAAAVERSHRLREILIEDLQKDVDAVWLQDNHGLGRKEFDALDEAERQRIQDAWNSENEIFDFERTEARVKDLEVELRAAKREATVLSREARKSNTADVNARLKVAKAEARELETRLAASRSRTQSLRADQNAFLRAAEALREASVVRARAPLGEPRNVGASTQKAWEKMQSAAKALDDYADETTNPTNTGGFFRRLTEDGRVEVNVEAARAGLAEEAAAVLKDAIRILPENFRVQLEQNIRRKRGGFIYELDGYHDPEKSLVAVALDSPDAAGTLRHEAIHALRQSGVISSEQWDVLKAAAIENDWAGQFGVERRYGKLYRQRFKGKEAQERLIEEAVAEAFARYREGGVFGGSDVEPFGFLRALLEAIKAKFTQKGLLRAEDVFERLEKGEFEGQGFRRKFDHQEMARLSKSFSDAKAEYERLLGAPATGTLDGQVVKAALQIGGEVKGVGPRVFLDDLRRALPNVPRADLDAKLVEMQASGKLHLFGNDERAALTASQKEAALNLGGPRHLIRLDRSVLGTPTRAAPKDPRVAAPKGDPRVQFLRGRAREAGQQADRWARFSDDLKNRHATMNGRLGEVRETRARLKEARALAKERAATATKARDKAARSLKKAEGALDRAQRRKSTREMIDQIVQGIQNRNEMPSALLYEDFVGQSSRQRYRKLNLNPDTMDRLVEEGFLETDLNRIGFLYARDVGGRMSIREKMGQNEDLSELLRGLDAEYDDQIAAAQAGGKSAAKLLREKEEVRAAIQLVRDRLLGRHDFLNAPGAEGILYFSKLARQANFLRYMGSVLPASITDLGTASLAAGFKSLPLAFTRNIEKIVREAPQKELMTVLYATENNPIFNRNARLYNLGDAYTQFGFGQGVTRKVTSSVENGTAWLTDNMNTLNGMRFWNGRLKFAAGYNILHNMLESGRALSAGRKLSQRQINDAAILGLDERTLQDLAEMTAEFGEDIEGGLRFPKLDEWGGTAKGRALERKLYVALNRALDKAVVTPRIADQPPFMSNWLGRLMFQFQSFAFASVNRWGRELDRRIVAGEMDLSTAAEIGGHVGFMLAMGITSYVIREGAIKGKWEEIEKQKDAGNAGHFIREAIDRGGFMFFLNPYFNGLMKLASANGLPVEDYGMLPSRYKQHSWASGFLGPSFQLFVDLQKAVTPSDAEDFAKTAKKLAPYNNLFYVDAAMRRLFDF
ncbi:MAG: hypothetical protein MI824_19125 [Hyphomicrobiales bacterium]|nr:hypothetical protein [Hyphomicrobiales bacterium]